ncbi:MAG: efflux RND transporter periplasmic adaptor subunit [Planctomycetia bacterium]|nr:efflux RND transporter periplasmic adaptor subunit [Planctomycetia bacterium]
MFPDFSSRQFTHIHLMFTSIQNLYQKYCNRRWKRWLVFTVGGVFLFWGFLQLPGINGWFSSFFQGTTDSSLQLVEPTFGTFVHEVTVRGDISSSSNVDIKCNVRSAGGTMLLSVVEEGTTVKAGDLLAVLDSSTLIDNKVTQEISCSKSLAEYATAENTLQTAIIAKKEYEEGKYLLSLQQLESAKIAAEEEQSRLAEYLEHSKKLYQKGFITKLQLDADEFALEQAQLDLDAAQLEIKVLKDYTHQKELIGYDSDIKTAEANKLAKERAYKLDMDKLKDIEDQITSCRILAPADGKVIYVNETRGPAGSEFIVYEGAMVRERQTFLRLPDPNKLQVIADVHEGKINYIKAGMPASVRTDATAGRDIRGTVIKVNELPQPTNFWMGNVKEYRVTIKIDPEEGVLPGMTADTRILVERQNDVLMIPTHTVFEHGGKYYTIVPTGKKWAARELELGSSNDKMVIVKSGVQQGEKILAAAFQHRDLIDLPELQPGQTATADIRPAVDSQFTTLDSQTVEDAQKEEMEMRRQAMIRRNPRGQRPDGEGGPSAPPSGERPRPPEGGPPPGGEGAPPPPGGAGGPPPGGGGMGGPPPGGGGGPR